jgi:hypothetical protein
MPIGFEPKALRGPLRVSAFSALTIISTQSARRYAERRREGKLWLRSAALCTSDVSAALCGASTQILLFLKRFSLRSSAYLGALCGEMSVNAEDRRDTQSARENFLKKRRICELATQRAAERKQFRLRLCWAVFQKPDQGAFGFVKSVTAKRNQILDTGSTSVDGLSLFK